MGIQEFLPQLEKITDFRPGINSLSQFSGKTIGVDVSVWIQNCLSSKSLMEGLLRAFNALPKLSLSAHVFAFMDRKLEFFNFYNISLILILDGSRNPLKAEENIERSRSVVSANSKFDNILASIEPFNESELIKCLKARIHPRNDIYCDLYEWARAREVRLVSAPIEADWQLCHMIRNKEINI